MTGIRRTWWLLLTAFALTGAFSLSYAQEILGANEADILEQNPLVSEAYAQLEAGQPEIALQKFQAALADNSNDLSALLGQAMIFAEQERHAEAFSAYDIIVQNFPKHAFAWNGRGLAAFNMEDFDAALNSFQQATVDHPINGFFYESLAWTQMCRGEFDQAAATAKQATLMYNRKSETSIYPLLIAYFSYLEIDEVNHAQRALKYAVQNKPSNRWPEPVINYLSGQIDAAEMISYVTDTAQETEAHTYIGLRLRAEGAMAASQKHFDWVARNGDSRVFEYTLARALNLQGSVALMLP